MPFRVRPARARARSAGRAGTARTAKLACARRAIVRSPAPPWPRSRKSIGLRAGSCVLPLHHPIRVAEEWAVVDNLSAAASGISFASGWQPNDFVLQPEHYADRQDTMFRDIDIVRRLWRGEAVALSRPRPARRSRSAPCRGPFKPSCRSGSPPPATRDLRAGGRAGLPRAHPPARPDVEELAEKLAIYRTAWRERGHPGDGHVTLMLHTFVGDDDDAGARDRARADEGLPAQLAGPDQEGRLVVPRVQGARLRDGPDPEPDVRRREPHAGGDVGHPGPRLRALLRDQRPVRHGRDLPRDGRAIEEHRGRRDRLPDRLRRRLRGRAPASGASQPLARAGRRRAGARGGALGRPGPDRPPRGDASAVHPLDGHAC